jgi:adenosine/AMP kinase
MNPSEKERQAGRLVTEVVRLTAAEVKALRATPKELVKGQPGQVIQLVGAVLEMNYGGTNAFTETADNLAVRYTNTTGALVSQAIETTGFIDQTASTMTVALPKIDAIATSAASEGQALVLHNTGDGEIAGNAANNNTLTVSVTYVVHELR